MYNIILQLYLLYTSYSTYNLYCIQQQELEWNIWILSTLVCVVVHNKGAGVDKDTYENEITITWTLGHNGVLTFHPSPRFYDISLLIKH